MKHPFWAAALAVCLMLGGCSDRRAAVPSQAGEESVASGSASVSDQEAYRYDALPGFPLPEGPVGKITYEKVMLGETATITDPDRIAEMTGLLRQVELKNAPEERLPGAQEYQVIRFFADAGSETPAYSLHFLLQAAYLETGDSISAVYPTLNWSNRAPEEDANLRLQLGRLVDSWVRPDASAEGQPDAEAPAEEELEALFTQAMRTINDLAAEDPASLLRQIFRDDIQMDYDHPFTVDGSPYIGTSRSYSELEDYYGRIFTGEALEWVLSTKFADMYGSLCFYPGGGASGIGFELISVEPLGENAYRGNYRERFLGGSTSEEKSTIFEVQHTAGGNRISRIDYRPSLLERG